MARKKRNPDGDSEKRRKPAATFPDPRAAEDVLRQIVPSPGDGARPDAPNDRARALLATAFREQDPSRRVQRAEETLALWPDCADAYVLLAEHAKSRKQALALYEKGVAAGERALGPDVFRQAEGHFWGLLETRPYMRARLGLVMALWTAGRRDEAVRHARDLLRLNPPDNQGVRYTLAGFLLFLDRDDDLEQLLLQYPDEATAAWAYTKALLAFRKHGDAIDARRLLKTAKKANKYVPAYLLGRKFPPAEPPGYYSLGGESEALNYIGGFMAGWKSTPGAVAWLRANVKTTKRKSDAARPQGPLALVKKWLNDRLPQEEDVWQADARQTPNWIRIGGEKVRPWVVLTTSRTHDLVLGHEMPEEEPASALLWDVLVRAMRRPSAGKPHRPREVQVRPGESWEFLRAHFEEIGVSLTTAAELDQLNDVFNGMCEHVCGKPEPGLLGIPGVTPRSAGCFYEAAAAFFQQEPWKKVGYESAVQVESNKHPGGPWYAVLMGQSGLTTGLALYDDLETLRRMWSGGAGDEENALETEATSVLFGEASDIPVADLEAATRHSWKVARADAYPLIFHKERGRTVRPPLARELELMEGCLRAIPDFVNRRGQDDPTREEMTAASASGEMKLALSWVAEAQGE